MTNCQHDRGADAADAGAGGEGDGWTCRVYEGDKCVAVITSTVSAEDAERAAAERARMPQGNGWEALKYDRP